MPQIERFFQATQNDDFRNSFSSKPKENNGEQEEVGLKTALFSEKLNRGRVYEDNFADIYDLAYDELTDLSVDSLFVNDPEESGEIFNAVYSEDKIKTAIRAGKLPNILPPKDERRKAREALHHDLTAQMKQISARKNIENDVIAGILYDPNQHRTFDESLYDVFIPYNRDFRKLEEDLSIVRTEYGRNGRSKEFADLKADMFSKHVLSLAEQADKLQKSYSDKDFVSNFGYLLHTAKQFKELSRIAEHERGFGFKVDKETRQLCEVLAKIGSNVYDKTVARADIITDPSFALFAPEDHHRFLQNAKDYVQPNLPQDYDFCLQNGDPYEKIANLAKESMINTLDRKIMQLDAIKEGVVVFDENGEVIDTKNPETVNGRDFYVFNKYGKLLENVTFTKNTGDIKSTATPQNVSLDTIYRGKERYETAPETKEAFQQMRQLLNDKDSIFRRSSPEYKNIQSAIKEVATKDMSANELNEKVDYILEQSEKYLVNAENKVNPSNYAKERQKAIQAIYDNLKFSKAMSKSTYDFQKEREKEIEKLLNQHKPEVKEQENAGGGLKQEVKQEANKNEIKQEVKKEEIKENIKQEDVKDEIIEDVKEEVKPKVMNIVNPEENQIGYYEKHPDALFNALADSINLGSFDQKQNNFDTGSKENVIKQNKDLQQ